MDPRLEATAGATGASRATGRLLDLGGVVTKEVDTIVFLALLAIAFPSLMVIYTSLSEMFRSVGWRVTGIKGRIVTISVIVLGSVWVPLVALSDNLEALIFTRDLTRVVIMLASLSATPIAAFLVMRIIRWVPPTAR